VKKIKIGIDASRAFLKNKTGVEVCSLELIRSLKNKLDDFEVILYVRADQKKEILDNFLKTEKEISKRLKKGNWKIVAIPFVRFWTQLGLALEILTNPVDFLLIPAHISPIIHPQKMAVVVHGLEYEKCPQSYSFFSKFFHRFFVKKSIAWASKVVAVSQNTKKDLIEIYRLPKEKIKVIYNGFVPVDNCLKGSDKISLKVRKVSQRFLFYIGRLEERKNIGGMIEAFELLKEKYSYEGQLVLAGKAGFGFDKIKAKIDQSRFKKEILQLGFISEEEKKFLFSKADVFLFPSFCEGFGIPILEAQSAGVPVITSQFPPMSEVAKDERILVDPKDTKQIAQKIFNLISDENLRKSVVAKGKKNIRRFSWEKAALEFSKLIKQELKKE